MSQGVVTRLVAVYCIDHFIIILLLG